MFGMTPGCGSARALAAHEHFERVVKRASVHDCTRIYKENIIKSKLT